MARKLAWLSLILGLAVPAWAAGSRGTISGTVKDSSGAPQNGATVEVLGTSPVPAATVFTGPTGAFVVPELAPGKYFVRVTAPLFLPSLREGVSLSSGATVVLNVTLNTLIEAVQVLPLRRRTTTDQDDWKWTVRSGANRPVLRVLDKDALVLVSKGDQDDDKVLKASIAFFAGSEGSGLGRSGDMNTAFSVESSIRDSGTFSVDGNVGYSEGAAHGGAVRASYSHKMADGSQPVVSVTMQRSAAPETLVRDGALQSLTLSVANDLTLFDFVDLSAGSEYQMVRFRGQTSAFRPFGSATIPLSAKTRLQYRYATSLPDTRTIRGGSSVPADFTRAGPRVALEKSKPVLERARHQELSLSRRFGKSSAELAWYSDNVKNLVLTGVGESAPKGDLLPDLYSGTFSYAGRNLNTSGMRLVLQREIVPDLTAVFAYSYGGVLRSETPVPRWTELRSALRSERQHALTCKVFGSLPGSSAQWSASYKWTGGEPALTAVDMFDVSAGQSDAYLNVFIRQPIPAPGFMAGRMEALVDVRNLLAQGYVPVVGSDGRTLYLVQSARAIRGGVAFNF